MKPEFKTIFNKIFQGSDRAFVIYSAIWPLSLGLKKDPATVTDELISLLLASLKDKQTLCMPTFTSGFTDGISDLDHEESTTGILTERFRTLPETRRTNSAFFSFAVQGSQRDFLCSLKPLEAWGAGSLYEWFHENDAEIITIGTHPTHCSFTHRAEWLKREIIPYRFEKQFEGTVVINGTSSPRKESLFVRKFNPTPHNDWTWLDKTFIDNGMNIFETSGVRITTMSAKKKMDIILPLIDKDPLCLIKNKEDFIGV